jgi:uncharacterized protein (TIGR02646 family)
MIRIKRPIEVPVTLSGLGKSTDTANRKLFDADPESYFSGKNTIRILNTIYGHATVKRALKTAQKNKCCFCEKDQGDEFGNVEHFRPKEGYRSKRKDKLSKPGYYWLGYEWSNLLFVCGSCNSAKYKGNLFPLVKDSRRAKSHNDDVARENPLLIDPAKNDPRKHIKFIGEFPQGLTQKGVETISICGLNRDALIGMRRKILNTIDDKIVIFFAKGTSAKEKAEAKKYLKECILPTSEFSAAAMDHIASRKIVIT